MDRTPRTFSARIAPRLVALVLTAVPLTACGGEADDPSASSSETPAESATSPEPSPEASPQPHEDAGIARLEPVKIKGDSVTPVAQSIEVEVGDTVTLEVSSDRAGEFHVHATPEQYPQFDQGASTVKMSFDMPGAVDVEEHESGALVLRVLVQ